MPLNILRLNQRQHHPNDRITFIKPLPHASSPAARDKADVFLRRVAAICYPIMKAHSLSVTTLEEFPPNREFMGRNFNNGEVIQLVLRRMPFRRHDPVSTYGRSAGVNSDSGNVRPPPSGISVSGGRGRIDAGSSAFVADDDAQHGGWLPLRSVTMVMMHELAHCIEMNHSRAFWAVRNDYAAHLRLLWSQGYTGEGMWGRERGLDTGGFVEVGGGSGSGDFDLLCGGAYRGRRRGKRGRAGREKVSYAERKRRRLERVEGKFGKGARVGDSETAKLLLEGRVNDAKPRVANSKRGRELRAAAALARFEKNKVSKARERETEALTVDDPAAAGTESETETEDEDQDDASEEHLLDEHGKPVIDSQGHDLYRVCGETDNTDPEARKELTELDDLANPDDTGCPSALGGNTTASDDNYVTAARPPDRGQGHAVGNDLETNGGGQPVYYTSTSNEERKSRTQAGPTTTSIPSPLSNPSPASQRSPVAAGPKTCPICSLENEVSSGTCVACAHVLDRSVMRHWWQCRSEGCLASGYTNAGDAGVCGICGLGRDSTRP